MLRLIKNRCQKLAYASVAENRSQKLTYLASGDWQPVPKCVPFFLFLLPRRSLHFSKQLHFSLLSPCNLANMLVFFSFSSTAISISLFSLPTTYPSTVAGSLVRCRRWVVAAAGSLPPLGRCRRWVAAAAVRCSRWFTAAPFPPPPFPDSLIKFYM